MKARRLLAAWALLLLASHAVRLLRPFEPERPPDVRAVEVHDLGVPGASEQARAIRIAYREWAPAEPGAPIVLLLHGSPGSSRDFFRLGPALGQDFRVLAPDLPGFGFSERDIADYSLRAHAAYVERFLDRVGAAQVHLLGFSMGGGVAVELADRAPERVRSLILLSAIGVQELELLGSYRLNRSIHGLQLAALWLLHEAVPHFGLLDGLPIDTSYARNFYDSDQRPLRGALERFAGPTLILHGERDLLVSVAAAREHHRLMPQSEITLFDTDHFMLFRDPEPLAGVIDAFVRRVESGDAVTRPAAAPERRALAARPFDPRDVPPATGFTLVVMMALIAAATLVSEDLTCIAAGLLVAQGRLGFLAAVSACFAGILVGDLLLFWAGRRLGRPWLERFPLRWLVSREKVATSSDWFTRRGPAVIVLSRFMPGARLPTYFAAGVLHTPFGRFLFYFALAVAAWTPLLVGLAAWLGGRIYGYFELFQRFALPGLLAVAFALWLLLFLLPRLLTYRGRRRLVGWWRRVTRWEFWPLWVFYSPVLVYIGWLMLRHRSVTLFTAANPGIPAGGFVGESKSAILDRLPPGAVARYRRIAGEAAPEGKLTAVRAFVEENGGDLPVVLKPDVGERGRGVLIARDWQAVERYLADSTADLVVQEYVPGEEFGVFYVRMPGEEKGRIFSITEKQLPTLTGDGRATLEQLVLRDPRAVALAAAYLKGLGAERHRVPFAGEAVALTDLGTHCRGAIFLDGARHRTPALESAVDRISHGFEGFYFGRYDLRVPSEDDFRRGKGLTVIELNGVTSEATHIYDPRISLVRAYRTLFEQWELAFEVARRNRERGVEVETPRRLARRLVNHFGQSRGRPGGGRSP